MTEHQCLVKGSIAASAPVRAFASRLNPSFRPSAFWEVSNGSYVCILPQAC